MTRRVMTVVCGCLGSLMLACNAPVALTQQIEARQLAADLHVQFARAADAGNRSVMADTDEAARSAASEAEQATQAVLRTVDALTPILATPGYGDPRRTLEAFAERFKEFRALDAEILTLAVENSNVKAQRLSFGPAREAAAGTGHLSEARAALDRFAAVNTELIALSRRNSDVRSLALSLGRKRTVAASCDDHLRALEEGLARFDNRATR